MNQEEYNQDFRERVESDSQEYNNEDAVWGPGPEAVESARQWDECTKNPGHNAFIPVWEFGAHHLPKLWQSEDFVELIKVWINLHVRIRVGINAKPAAEANGAYDNGQRVGTGFLLGLYPMPDNFACNEKYCSFPPGQSHRSWTVHISTAKHVVNEYSLQGKIFVDFFNDYNGAGEEQRTTLKGNSVVFTDDGWDWCYFTCECCDAQLAGQLLKHIEQRKKLQESTRSWMEQLSPRPNIFVSFPHGKPKYVTVGELRGWDRESGMWTYTTDTCPGVCGSSAVGRWGTEWGYRGVHHCRGSADGKGLNKGFYSWI